MCTYLETLNTPYEPHGCRAPSLVDDQVCLTGRAMADRTHHPSGTLRLREEGAAPGGAGRPTWPGSVAREVGQSGRACPEGCRRCKTRRSFCCLIATTGTVSLYGRFDRLVTGPAGSIAGSTTAVC